MPAITYEDLDPQGGDSVLTLKIKEILSVQAATAGILGEAGDTEPPQADASNNPTESWTQLEAKLLASIREHQAALEE